MQKPLAKKRRFLFQPRLSIKEQIFFAKRLSFLLSAGIPLAQSLEIIEGQAAAPRTQRLYLEIATRVGGGQTLSQAMNVRVGSISSFMIAMVRIGEISGTLPGSLAFVADELEKKLALKRKITSSLMYPAIIVFVTVGVTLVLILYIFPKITPIFLSLHVPLPLSTRLLIACAHALSQFGLWLAAGLFFLGLLFAYGRKRFLIVGQLCDRCILTLPFFGQLTRSYHLANTCRTLSILLGSSVPMVEALAMTARAQRQSGYSQALHRAAGATAEGAALPRILENYHRLFPPLCTQLIAIGEQTGNLSAILSYLSELYESDVDARTKNLSTAIEPLLMLTMGLTVGFIAISIITPIYGITGHLTPK